LQQIKNTISLKQSLRRQFSHLVLFSLILMQVGSLAAVYLIHQDSMQMQAVESCMLVESDAAQEFATAEDDKLFPANGNGIRYLLQNDNSASCVLMLDKNTLIEINTPPPEYFV
jgi:hypothetical protein